MELRLYSFVNFYLSSIQQGIQTGHVAVDLVRKYTASGNPLNREITGEKEEMVVDWADNWKTFITLNGGNAEGIYNATNIIARNGAFPWAVFKEDEASLGGIQTCAAVILPEWIFNSKLTLGIVGPDFYSYKDDEGNVFNSGPEDRHFELIQLVKSCRLAS